MFLLPWLRLTFHQQRLSNRGCSTSVQDAERKIERYTPCIIDRLLTIDSWVHVLNTWLHTLHTKSAIDFCEDRAMGWRFGPAAILAWSEDIGYPYIKKKTKNSPIHRYNLISTFPHERIAMFGNKKQLSSNKSYHLPTVYWCHPCFWWSFIPVPPFVSNHDKSH